MVSDGIALISIPHPSAPRRKRVSKRRWKARALLGQYIPWTAIVEHRLEDWADWERRHDYMDAYICPRRRRKGVEWFQREVFISYPMSTPDAA